MVTDSLISKDLATAFRRPGMGSGGKIQSCPDKKTEESTILDARLKCTSFDWISSWKTTSSSPYGGRATVTYLMEHPEEADKVHVVTS
jgi:hypothetical protein